MKKNNSLQSLFLILGLAVLGTPVLTQTTNNAKIKPSAQYQPSSTIVDRTTRQIKTPPRYSARQSEENYINSIHTRLEKAKKDLQKAEAISDEFEINANRKKIMQLQKFIIKHQNS